MVSALVQYQAASARRRTTDSCRTLEGTLQRVNYGKKELTVVAESRVWHFRVAGDCELWFDDQPAILRCFHPLDRVVVFYSDAGMPQIKAMYAWEKPR